VAIDNILLHKQIKQVFDMVKADEIKGLTKKEPYIRPSMAPACSLKMFIKVATGIGNDSQWPDDMNFLMDYYTSVGTTTHTVFQRWFGRTGRMLGNWSCLCKGISKIKVKHGRKSYKEERPVVYIEKILPQQNCPHCGLAMHYEEVTIEECGYGGHVDGIIEFLIGKKKYHIVIDFKGTNAEKIKRDNPQRPEYPDAKHVKQISVYTYNLKQRKELNVVGWALLYTSRDTPIPKFKIIPHAMSELDWTDAKELHDSQVKQVRILNKSLDDGNIQRILKHKLCPNHKYYRSKVDARYHECEYADCCFSAPKHMFDLLKDAKKCLNL
jgi:hypothetical protein